METRVTKGLMVLQALNTLRYTLSLKFSCNWFPFRIYFFFFWFSLFVYKKKPLFFWYKTSIFSRIYSTWNIFICWIVLLMLDMFDSNLEQSTDKNNDKQTHTRTHSCRQNWNRQFCIAWEIFLGKIMYQSLFISKMWLWHNFHGIIHSRNSGNNMLWLWIESTRMQDE